MFVHVVFGEKVVCLDDFFFFFVLSNFGYYFDVDMFVNVLIYFQKVHCG